MELRFFQIIIPGIALLFLLGQLREFLRGDSNLVETILISILWLGVAVLAIFPDYFSDLIAKFFGIKDNVNAIIFLAIGVLFYFQIQLFKLTKKQDEHITELTRKIALTEQENKRHL